MVINVTQKHIDEGARRDCERCPVAKAIIEQVPNCTYVEVSEDKILIDVADSPFSITPPDGVADFISDFDDETAVFPFSFELDLSEQS